MRRSLTAAAFLAGLAGCGGGSDGLYSASSTKPCLQKHGVSVTDAAPAAVRGIVYERALGSSGGVVLFARSEEGAQTARRKLVELSRRDAQAMSPDEPADVTSLLVVRKNAVVLWRRQSDRGVVLGCLR